MTDDSVSLSQLYAGWTTYNAQLLNAVRPLSPDQLTLRAAPQLRTVAQLVGHIIGVREGWFHVDMSEGGSDYTPFLEWGYKEDGSYDVPTLLRGLETTWQLISDCLARWTVADLFYTFHTTEDGVEQSFTRQWVIWHVLEHDINHGGELSLTLGMHGLHGLDL